MIGLRRIDKILFKFENLYDMNTWIVVVEERKWCQMKSSNNTEKMVKAKPISRIRRITGYL